ncbi:hypothetical protein B4099_3629 [Heyndrickxia coagulans]|uniref:Uncharacterized protein n=1 Tax=Heyndrickxia coagulans TaxID=1398 RepID=A0A150K3T1_HEYCO|nr:hypothetical protein B4099_3629 [Heyndrickxia coagulans]
MNPADIDWKETLFAEAGSFFCMEKGLRKLSYFAGKKDPYP